MTTIISATIGAIIGGALGTLAYRTAYTDTAQRLICRLRGHRWHTLGYIEHQCEEHGLERVEMLICGRCGKHHARPDMNLRTTPHE